MTDDHTPAPLAERLRKLMAKATTGRMTVERCDDSVDGAIQYEIYRDHGRIAVLHADEVGGRAKGTAELIAFMLSEIDTLLAALDGREAWNEAIAACVAALDEYPTAYGLVSLEPTKARLRALARPQPAGEAE